MSTLPSARPVAWRDLMRTSALVYFYRRRLRIHAIQEILAGVGVAVAVALVFAVTVANSSITSSASDVVRAVVGPADLQLHARSTEGFDERLLSRVERLPGVAQAAPLLEQTATVRAPNGRRTTINIAGTDISLAVLDGLAHTLPLGALSPGGIGLSTASARTLALPAYTAIHARSLTTVQVGLRGRSTPLKVSAVLGRETAGALAQAQVGVMPLPQLQQLARLPGRVTRILVQSKPGHRSMVEGELRTLAAGKLTLAPATQDISLLHQALRPSNQASALFAGLSALLGFLFAFNALLLTIPERREAIADLRLDGTPRIAIVQMVVFQALCLGVVASVLGLLGGYALSTGVFHQSPGYLMRAFTLGTSTVIGLQPVLLAFGGGMLATCLASMVPLLDLRRRRPINAVFLQSDAASDVPASARRWLVAGTGGLVLLATGLLVLAPSAAIVACVLLALATVLAVPVVLHGVLRAAEVIALRNPRFTVLPLALTSLKATTFRSLALAATGAVALFGSVALGASRDDLLRGIDRYTQHYTGSADIWLVNPSDNQAINSFTPSNTLTRIRAVPGVASVHAFQGTFLDLGNRRVWVIAWPTGTHMELLRDQIIHGSLPTAIASLQAGGSVAISDQIASEHHLKIGTVLALPTPTGTLRLRVAATTTNFGWSPGAILMNTSDYQHAWASTAPSALGVNLTPGANPMLVRSEIERVLGPRNGLEVLTASAREAAIDRSASEGLAQLGEISTLLVIAAILAMAAALSSSIWQRRKSLAELRLEGSQRRQIRLVLLVESTLMLSAGCLAGVVAGIYGQIVIDSYLKHVTGFPVAGVATGQRPIAIFALVIAAVLLIVSPPGWLASRVSSKLALE